MDRYEEVQPRCALPPLPKYRGAASLDHLSPDRFTHCLLLLLISNPHPFTQNVYFIPVCKVKRCAVFSPIPRPTQHPSSPSPSRPGPPHASLFQHPVLLSRGKRQESRTQPQLGFFFSFSYSHKALGLNSVLLKHRRT